MGVPALQVVAWHLSAMVQGSLSSHIAAGSGSTLHPVAGSQLFFVHGLVSEQSTAGPGVHFPAWHELLIVHLLVLTHGVLSLALEWLHCWVVALQVSVVHGSLSLQSLPTPTHLPPVHLSPTVQSLRSVQLSLSGLGVFTQPVILLQVSTVQSCLSSQEIIEPGTQTPD
jgi:hypothetical protein